jgi:hypothetical protein
MPAAGDTNQGGRIIAFTFIDISLFTFSAAVNLPLLKEEHGRTGRNTLQSWVNNSLTLNLIYVEKES